MDWIFGKTAAARAATARTPEQLRAVAIIAVAIAVLEGAGLLLWGAIFDFPDGLRPYVVLAVLALAVWLGGCAVVIIGTARRLFRGAPPQPPAPPVDAVTEEQMHDAIRTALADFNTELDRRLDPRFDKLHERVDGLAGRLPRPTGAPRGRRRTGS